jgi:ketosteroid isomerase-like protein
MNDTKTAILTGASVGTSRVAGTCHGREQILEKVIRPFGSRVSRPLVPTVRGLYADDDTVVVLFDNVAVAKDGRPCENTCSWCLQIRGVGHGQAETI